MKSAMSKKPKILAKKIDLDVSSLGKKGDGVALWSQRNAHVYIDGALPDETVITAVSRGHDELLRGKITNKAQVLKVSPFRADPPCKYAYRCGGCSLQHMQEAFYKTWKKQSVLKVFERSGIAPNIWYDDIFVPQGTRRRAHFTVLKQNSQLMWGFREKRSHTILDIENCLVVTPQLFQDAQNMRPYISRIARDSRVLNVFVQATHSGYDIVLTGEIGAKGEPDLAVHEAAAEMINALPVARLSWRRREREEPQLLLEKNPLRHEFGTLDVTLPPMAFMQPSKEGETALVAAMMRGVSQYAPKKEKLKMADLFAGCGTLTGVMAETNNVQAYESDNNAVKTLNMALMKKAKGDAAFRRDLFKDPLTANELEQFDVFVMDPPRAGAKRQSEELAHLAEVTMDDKCLIYISCNPSSFARDAEKLIKAGWRFETAQMVDQFIWSDHVELCGVFTCG